jgi:hypothetical protein
MYHCCPLWFLVPFAGISGAGFYQVCGVGIYVLKDSSSTALNLKFLHFICYSLAALHAQIISKFGDSPVHNCSIIATRIVAAHNHAGVWKRYRCTVKYTLPLLFTSRFPLLFPMAFDPTEESGGGFFQFLGNLNDSRGSTGVHGASVVVSHITAADNCAGGDVLQ